MKPQGNCPYCEITEDLIYMDAHINICFEKYMNRPFTVIYNHFSHKRFNTIQEAQNYILSKPENLRKFYYTLNNSKSLTIK